MLGELKRQKSLTKRLDEAAKRFTGSWLERIRDQSLEGATIVSARLQADAAAECDKEFTMRGGLQFLDSTGVDHQAAVDAQKEFRVERFLKRPHGYMQKMVAALSMKLHVIFGRFHPFDLVDIDEDRLARSADSDAADVALGRADGFQKLDYLAGSVSRRSAREPCLCALECPVKPCGRDWF